MMEYCSWCPSRYQMKRIFQSNNTRNKEEGTDVKEYLEINQQAFAIVATSFLAHVQIVSVFFPPHKLQSSNLFPITLTQVKSTSQAYKMNLKSSHSSLYCQHPGPPTVISFTWIAAKHSEWSLVFHSCLDPNSFPHNGQMIFLTCKLEYVTLPFKTQGYNLEERLL